jgi:hypothetical protein
MATTPENYTFAPQVLTTLQEHDVTICQTVINGRTIISFDSPKNLLHSEDGLGPFVEPKDGEKVVIPGAIIVDNRVLAHTKAQKTASVPGTLVFDISELASAQATDQVAA